jgi:hypothetical protein
MSKVKSSICFSFCGDLLFKSCLFYSGESTNCSSLGIKRTRGKGFIQN